jgi:hypothetical protein
LKNVTSNVGVFPLMTHHATTTEYVIKIFIATNHVFYGSRLKINTIDLYCYQYSLFIPLNVIVIFRLRFSKYHYQVYSNLQCHSSINYVIEGSLQLISTHILLQNMKTKINNISSSLDCH